MFRVRSYEMFIADLYVKVIPGLFAGERDSVAESTFSECHTMI